VPVIESSTYEPIVNQYWPSASFWQGFKEGWYAGAFLIGVPISILVCIAAPTVDARFSTMLPFAFVVSLWWAYAIRDVIERMEAFTLDDLVDTCSARAG